MSSSALSRGARAALAWVSLAAASALVLAFRLELSFDLSAFFPRETELEHEILLQQFRHGPGSRLLVIGVRGAPRAELADFSDRLRNALADEPHFSQVQNGEVAEELAALPAPVDTHYLLLGDLAYDEAALERVLDERLRDLAFGGGQALLDIVARDPYLVSLEVLQRLSAVELATGHWFSADGAAVIVAETRAAAVDVDAQVVAIRSIRKAFDEESGGADLSLDITGVGAFSAELRDTIRSEATLRSIVATLALLVVLLAFLRRPRYLLLASLPIGLGYLVGLAVVSAVFDTVHGITLAFGFTLMGVAIDYPLHLINHHEAAGDGDAHRRIWPTLRLGAISTAIAYLALLVSGSAGLAQLGVFSACGLLVAALATHTWLPHLLPRGASASAAAARDAERPRLAMAPALLATAGALFAIAAMAGRPWADALWNDELASLSPVPEARLDADRRLRAATGAVDMRYQLTLSHADLEGVLAHTERLDARLAAAADAGHLAAWRSVSAVLPSRATQARRRAAIPEPAELRARLRRALADTPFREHAFDPFLDRAAASRELALLDRDSFRDTPLAGWLDVHLLRIRDQWVSLVSLKDPDPARLAELVPGWPEPVTLVDLRRATVELMRDYRGGVFRTVSLAALGIVLLIWVRRQRFADVVWVTLTVAAAVLLTMLCAALLHGQLTVIHLIALLLVMGLGLDYALFLSRTEAAAERRASRRAVLVCAASTTLAFGILAASSIPVLAHLGLTVAAGSAVSYLLAVAGSRFVRP